MSGPGAGPLAGGQAGARAGLAGHPAPGPGGGAAPVTDPALAARLLDAAIGQADARDRPDLRDRLVRERTRLAAPDCLVAVVGEFKQGKSSLVNALLGARVCATDPVATTALPTLVRHAPSPSARLVQAGPPSQPEMALGTDENPVDSLAGGPRAADFAARLADLHARAQESPTRASRIISGPAPGTAVPSDRVPDTLTAARAEVALPRRLLAEGLTLLDTPGLAGGLTDGRAGETLRAAADAEAVIFVTDASQELTAPELETVRRLTELHPVVLVAVTKTDVYPRWREIVETNRGHLARHALAPPVFGLATVPRHHALRTGDADLDAESGYPALVGYLRSEIIGGRRARLAAVAGEAARDAMRQLLAELRARRDALADPGNAASAVAELAEAEREGHQLAEAAAGWRRVLAERAGTMTVLLREDLDSRLHAVETGLEQRIKTSEPARDWDDLRRALYQQTNDALLGHRMQLRSQMSMVLDAVTREFDSGSAKVRALLDAAVEQPVVTLEDARAPELQQLRGLDVLMYGARSGGVGTLLVSAAGTVATVVGASAATASIVLAPVGLGLVFLLGRRSVSSLRQNERRAHRAEATRAVREYLATARRIAAADSVATRDQLERSVRATLGELATELMTSAQRNREAAALAARESTGSRQARLTAVDAEIASLLNAARAATTGAPAAAMARPR